MKDVEKKKMITSELKRKVRKLKQFENTVRAQNNMEAGVPLVWSKFFDLRETGKSNALYTLSKLSSMSKDEYKSVTEEFFARVYYEIYIHNGIIDAPIYDAKLLEQIGLPPIANEITVKKKFRELAMQHHPDKGGNAEEFINLMKTYNDLTNIN